MKRTKGVGPQGLGVSPFKEVDSTLESTENPELGSSLDDFGNPFDPNARGASYYVVGGGQGTGGQSITQGMSQDEVVVNAGPRKKTRAEHRLDKTQSKGEAAAEAGNYNKANRLQARKQRLLDKIDRQKDKDKKRYVRKDKKYWRDQEENN